MAIAPASSDLPRASAPSPRRPTSLPRAKEAAILTNEVPGDTTYLLVSAASGADLSPSTRRSRRSFPISMSGARPDFPGRPAPTGCSRPARARPGAGGAAGAHRRHDRRRPDALCGDGGADFRVRDAARDGRAGELSLRHHSPPGFHERGHRLCHRPFDRPDHRSCRARRQCRDAAAAAAGDRAGDCDGRDVLGRRHHLDPPRRHRRAGPGLQ